MSPRSTILFAITAAVALPVVALAAFPYLRRPTPKPTRPPPRLPAGVERKFTQEGLEILVAKPPSDHYVKQAKRLAPILLLHGGFGTAMVWSRWLPYLASKGRAVYAISLSGHGESPRPRNFVHMGLRDMSRDVQAALSYILFDLLDDTATLMPDPVIVAHSLGGGLAQYALANSEHDEPFVSGLVLLGSIPPSGMHEALVAWLRLDPQCIPRFLRDMGDLRSPLSTRPLVQRAFFGEHTPQRVVQEFFDCYMNHEEAVSWVREMVFPYVEPREVMAKVPEGRVFCVGGDQDALITPDMANYTANEYGGLEYVRPSGHYIQNDVSWREAADIVLNKMEEWGL